MTQHHAQAAVRTDLGHALYRPGSRSCSLYNFNRSTSRSPERNGRLGSFVTSRCGHARFSHGVNCSWSQDGHGTWQTCSQEHL
jgi:hypothetical protein